MKRLKQWVCGLRDNHRYKRNCDGLTWITYRCVNCGEYLSLHIVPEK